MKPPSKKKELRNGAMNLHIMMKEICSMKKMFALAMAAVMALTLLAGCSGGANGGSSAGTKTPEELKTLYTDAITANGGEMVEYNPVFSEATEENAMLLEMMGLKEEDMTAFAVSVSMMNVKAYGIAAVMPAEGKAEAVREALQGFIDQKQMEFEFYLADQYDVAKSARLETLEDGTVLMVMGEGSDEMFRAISAAIQNG